MDEQIRKDIDNAVANLVKNGCQPEFLTPPKVQAKKAGEAWVSPDTKVIGTSGSGEGMIGYVSTTINPCCVCVGSCNHTGPHQFCPNHGANLQAPTITVTPGPLQPDPNLGLLQNPPLNTGLQGWICPVCKTGVSPYATTCPNHNNGNQSPFQIQPWPWNPNQFFD